MTEEELALLRANMQTLVAESLLKTCYVAMRRLNPLFPQEFLQKANPWLQTEMQHLSIPGLKPGYSDLVAAEVQEAIDRLLKQMETW